MRNALTWFFVWGQYEKTVGKTRPGRRPGDRQRWFEKNRIGRNAANGGGSVRDSGPAHGVFGTWPVLVGEEGERDTMLSAPIILYGYPQIAPESPADLFDNTEIDGLLTLRILTLTDEEKAAMAALDSRCRDLLEHAQAHAREELMGLHGTFRGVRASTQDRPALPIPAHSTAPRCTPQSARLVRRQTARPRRAADGSAQDARQGCG